MMLFWVMLSQFGWEILDDEPENVSANILRISFGDSISIDRLSEYETIKDGLEDLTLSRLMEESRSALRSHFAKIMDRVYGYVEMRTYNDTDYHLKATFYESDERPSSL